MDNDFRRNVLTPILMLVGLVVGVAIVAISISRVLLTVPETVATFTALALAAYVLAIAVLVGARPRISSQALGAGLVVGLIALMSAGVISAQAGMRDLHEGEAAEGEGGEGAEGEGDEGGEAVEEIPEGAATWVSVDNEFTAAPESIPAGEATIALDNQGNLLHTLVFEGADVFVEADAGAQAATTVTLEPGTYTFFCDVPGHRATMEGEVTVE
ncbi:MAG: cupredoxin domain-containing protein [Euzebyales bacterium]|nr:cupredoxin domain-containing protein [Euzebyales bacterium]